MSSLRVQISGPKGPGRVSPSSLDGKRVRLCIVTETSSFQSSCPCIHFNHLTSLKFVFSQSDSAGYDPRRSRVSDNTMMDFVRGTISGDLTEVPGIGPKTAEKLAEGNEDGERVTNTYQLVGKVRILENWLFSVVVGSLLLCDFSYMNILSLCVSFIRIVLLVPHAQRT